MAMPGMESPNVSRTRTGFLVAGIGLILSAFLGFIGTIIVIVGAAMIFSGSREWPAARGTAAAGFGLIILALILGIVGFVIFPSLLFFAPPVGADPATVLESLRNFILLAGLAAIVGWLGILVLPWRLTSGSSKGLVIAGFVLGLLGALTILGLAYMGLAGLSSTTDPDVLSRQLVSAILGLLLGFGLFLLGYILAGVGYIIGRNKLPTAMAPMAGIAPQM